MCFSRYNVCTCMEDCVTTVTACLKDFEGKTLKGLCFAVYSFVGNNA